MRAVRLHDKLDLRVEEVAPPGPPPPGHVTLKVKAAGICGSDLHNYRTGQWITRRPSTPGHEFCGIVSAVGAGVEGFSAGDLAVADSRFWCGECAACRSGRANVCERLGFVGEVCDGGFAEEVQLPARLLCRVPGNVPYRIAAMAEPLAVALPAVRRLRLPLRSPGLVIGCGTIGGLCALLLSRLHGGPLLVSDLNTQRARLVTELAAARSVNLEAGSITAALGGQGLRFAIDATGNVQAIRAALDFLTGGGSLALVGISHGRLDLDPNLLVEREIGLIGCHAFADELAEAVSLLPGLVEALDQVWEAITSLEEVPQTYGKLLEGGSTKLKSMVIL